MKTFASAVCVLALLGTGAAAQTFDDLKKDGNGGSTDNILTYGMGYQQQRYSPLKQINKQTVKRLVPVWNLSLDNNWGEQAQPIIYNGVMYVTDAKATVAIDVATGKQVWKQTLDWPPETPRVICCGVSNKGAAIYNLLFTGKETGEFIAVDADTGKIVWQFQTGSGINAMPVTYTHQGRQYVTVLSGIGGLYWNIARERLKDKVPQGGSVWTFALLPE